MGGILLLIALVTGLLIYSRWANAGSASLYPGSCLGSWKNPHLAQKKPETQTISISETIPAAISSVSEIGAINKENSAVFSEGGIKEIYCGSFNGDFSESEIKLIKSVNLKFSWLVSDEEPRVATSSITIIQPLATSSEAVVQNTNDVINQILDNIHADKVQVIVSTTTSEVTITTNTANPETAVTSDVQISPTSDVGEATTTPTASVEVENAAAIATSSPTSYWWKKYNFFSADDQISNTSTPVVDSSAITAGQVSETIPAATSSLESPIAPTEDFLKVSYTLDGVSWQELGTVNKNNWQNLAFEIPVYQLEDIKKIQIKIESLPILNKTPYVYLDGMALELEYETSLISQPETAAILSQQSNFVSYSSYNRTLNSSNTDGPISISVSVDSFDDFGFNNGCGLNSQSCDFWGIRVTDFDNKSFNSKCVSNETLSHTFTFDLPAGSYIEVMAYAGHTQESCERGGEMSKFLEGNNSGEIFTVTGQ